jgi:hypothetical protein
MKQGATRATSYGNLLGTQGPQRCRGRRTADYVLSIKSYPSLRDGIHLAQRGRDHPNLILEARTATLTGWGSPSVKIVSRTRRGAR